MVFIQRVSRRCEMRGTSHCLCVDNTAHVWEDAHGWVGSLKERARLLATEVQYLLCIDSQTAVVYSRIKHLT